MDSVCIFAHSTKTQNMHTHRHTHTLTHSVTHRHTHSLTKPKFCYLDTCRSGAHGQWAAPGGPPSASAWLSECHLWPGTEGGGRTPRWTHSLSQPHSMQNPGSFALQAERERKASYGLYQWSAGKWFFNSPATISSMHTSNTRFFCFVFKYYKHVWMCERGVCYNDGCPFLKTTTHKKQKPLHSHGPSHFCARNLHIYY